MTSSHWTINPIQSSWKVPWNHHKVPYQITIKSHSIIIKSHEIIMKNPHRNHHKITSRKNHLEKGQKLAQNCAESPSGSGSNQSASRRAEHWDGGFQLWQWAFLWLGNFVWIFCGIGDHSWDPIFWISCGIFDLDFPKGFPVGFWIFFWDFMKGFKKGILRIELGLAWMKWGL